MILTEHAQKRFSERILLPVGSIQSELAERLGNRDYSRERPRWTRGSRDSISHQGWMRFRDLDGIECVALADVEQGTLVTVLKKGF